VKRVEEVRRAATGSVVVTDDGAGHGRSALAAVRALAAAGYRPAVARSGPWSLAASSRSCVRTFDVGPVEGEGFADACARVAADCSALTILPSSDAALLALGAPVVHLLDKSRLISAAHDAALPTAETRVFDGADALRAAANELSFPVVVKLPISRVPARRVNAASELTDAAGVPGPLLVQPFIDAPLWAVGGVVWNGRLVAAVHQRYVRTWPLDCGTASAAVTVAPDRRVEERLVRLLDGYDGIFQAQFAGDYLLDLNPRVYGSLPLAVAAGVNLPGIVCDLLRGEDVPLVRAREGAAYRWVEGDVRALLGLARRKEIRAAAALRALRPRTGSAHSVLSWRDPGPFLSRLRYAMRRR
jgi:predicted ATP-grasp superfamily ATP-dependent carboligase